MKRKEIVAGAALLALALAIPGFGSAQAPTANGALSLEEAYALAGSSNPRLTAAHGFANAVHARESAASVLPDPSFQLGVMNLALPALSADMPSSMAPSVQFTQKVPFPGKLGLSGDIARLSTAMAESGAEEMGWDVRTRTAQAFYGLYEADRQIEVMQETLALLRDFEKVARAMYTAGHGRQSDVLRASVEVAHMDAEIERMRAMRRAAAARLNRVLNRPAETGVRVADFPHLPADVPTADSLLMWADGNRPMLERARQGVEQAGVRHQLARRQIWPDLMLGVQYGRRPADTGTRHMASAMVGFSLPIFASRRQLPMRDETLAMESMARADLDDLRAGVDARIIELLADLQRDRTLVRLYCDEILPQAHANVQSSLASYRVGAVDFMTLVDARMTVNRYEQDLIRLLADYGRAVAELEMTVGRELPRSAAVLTEDR